MLRKNHTRITDITASDEPRDAGALGIVHHVNELSELEAFYQFEALRAAPLEMQMASRIRFAALRRRLFDGGLAA